MTGKKQSPDRGMSRRDLLKMTAGASSALALGGLGVADVLWTPEARAQGGKKSAVLLLFMTGGYNALFASPDSFLNRSFGVTGNNMLALANGLFVDSVFAPLSAYAKAHMASVGVNHGIAIHGQAQNAQFSIGNQNPLMLLAATIGGSGSIKCANVGAEMAPGPKGAVSGITLQQIADMQTTIDALGNGASDPTMPKRELAAKGVAASQEMSKQEIEGNPNMLNSAQSGYKVAIDTLNKPPQIFDPNELKSAYRITSTSIRDFTSKMAAAELAIRAGANVVAAATPFVWDSHGDTQGTGVRNRFTGDIMPGLKTFTDRMMQEQGEYNVTIVIIGDFARSLPGSDHATVSVATIIGPNINPGTTGKVDAAVGLPLSTPSVNGLWALVAAASGVGSATMATLGANPHASLIKT